MTKRFFLFVIGGFALALIIVLAAMGGFAFHPGTPAPQGNGSAALNGPPGPPPAPQISLTIRKLKTGNSLIVEWTNLPQTTAALDLFCSALLKPTTSSTWTLWKEILLSSGELAAGNREVALGIWYNRCSFYVVQATATRSSLKIGATTTLAFANGIASGESDSTVLWTSGITLPGITTSTVGLPSLPATPAPSGNGPVATSSNQAAAPPSGNPTGPQQTTSSANPTNPTQNPTSSPIGSPTPSGTPYYDPQIKVYGYVASGSPVFWVQDADQGIELGWQNIPPNTDTIVILRSKDQDGPWDAFLTEKNLPTNNYSLQVVDSAVGTPYYYEMQAISGSTTVATFGPDYLAPLGQ